MMLLRSNKYKIPTFYTIYKSLTNFLFLNQKNQQCQIEKTPYIFYPNMFQSIRFNSSFYIFPLYTKIFPVKSKLIYYNSNIKTEYTFKYLNTLLKTMFFLLTKIFETNIILSGLGFKSEIKKNILYLNLGYSHYFKIYLPILFTIVAIETSTFTIKSKSNFSLGNFIFALMQLKKINPYTADGISVLKKLYIS